jgi:hypothetical protein
MVLPLVSHQQEGTVHGPLMVLCGGFKGTQAWHCVFGWVAAGVWKGHSGFIFKVNQSSKTFPTHTQQHCITSQKTWILHKTDVKNPKSLKVLMWRYPEGSAHDSSDALQRLFAWYKQQRPSRRTAIAPAEPSTMWLPNTTIRHYHDIILRFSSALFMAGTRTQGINRTWYCTSRGGSVYNTAVTGTEFSIIYSKCQSCMSGLNG